VLRAFGIRGRRGRRPMICFLAFLRSGEGRRTKGGPTPGGAFLRYGEGQRAPAHLVARDAGSLKWPIMRSRRPWSLGARAALIHVFAIARPAGSSARCVSPQDHDDLRLVALESWRDQRSESTTGCWCSAILLQPGPAAPLPLRCHSAADAVCSAAVWVPSVVAHR
jgi:hypothetical protein